MTWLVGMKQLPGLPACLPPKHSQYLNWTVLFGCDFEAEMVSTERLEQHSNLQSDAPRETEMTKVTGLVTR